MIASPFDTIVPASETPAAAGPADWDRIKADIVARLDVQQEFAALDVIFTGKRWDDRLECFGLDREDPKSSIPSAVVYESEGYYFDSGSGKPRIHLVDLAVQRNHYPKWILAIKAYAAKAGVAIPAGVRENKGRVLERTFDYRTADGATSYRVYRYITATGDKTFSQHAIDAKGNARWGGGAMDGVAPLPYGLDRFRPVEESDGFTFIVEGEKVCEALWSLGLDASTAHGGAGSARKNWPAIAGYFAGRDVVILPDNDEGGRKYADAACAALRGVAATVRRLALPGLPPKGDAVEWIAAGGTKEALLELADAAAAWEPGSEEEAEAELAADDPVNRIATLADLRVTLSADAWLWTGWIPSAALCLVAAEPGCGKTRQIMDLHRRLIYGLPWPDGTPTPVIERPKFLWILADNQHQQVCLIAEEFGIPDELVLLNTNAADPHGGTDLETADQLADFEARIAEHKPVMAVIDTITNTGDFKSQDSVDAKRQYKPIQEIAGRQKTPIACVTHLNASGKALGRRALEKVRTALYLSQPDPEGQPDRRRFWVEKTFAAKPPALGVTVSSSSYEYDNDPPAMPDANDVGPRKGRPPAATKAAMDWLGDFAANKPSLRIRMTVEEGVAAGHSESAVFRAADALGFVKSDSPTGRGKIWTPPSANDAA